MNEPRPLNTKEFQRLAQTPDQDLTRTFPGRPRKWLRAQKRAYVNANPAGAQVEADITVRRERADKRNTEAKYKEVLKDRNKLQTELDALTLISGHTGRRPVKVRSKKGKHEATAVALASDWHAEEPVDPGKISGLNEYNLTIFAKRSSAYFTNLAALIKKEQQAVDINTLVLWLGGDFFTNNIHEDAVESNALGPIDAALLVQETIAGGIEYLLKNTDVTILLPCSSL